MPGRIPCPAWRQTMQEHHDSFETVAKFESVMMKHKAPPPVADINVTPMVDVMLVMLIIFMVITPMLSKGVSVDMVKTKNPIPMQAADKSDAVVVAITRDGKTYLGSNQTPAAD